jgi:hypothetical protein
VEGFCDNEIENAFCRDSNVVEPIFAWTPTLAVAGIEFYNADLIPDWKNSILVTSLKAGRITQLKLNESGTEVIKSKDFFIGQFGRLRDICISPEGKVYIAVSNRDGRGSPKADDDKIVEIAPVPTTSQNNIRADFVSIFPNPAAGFVNVSFPVSVQSAANYVLFSVNGQILQSGKLEAGTSKLYLPENYEGLAILKLVFSDHLLIEKILIKK